MGVGRGGNVLQDSLSQLVKQILSCSFNCPLVCCVFTVAIDFQWFGIHIFSSVHSRKVLHGFTKQVLEVTLLLKCVCVCYVYVLCVCYVCVFVCVLCVCVMCVCYVCVMCVFMCMCYVGGCYVCVCYVCGCGWVRVHLWNIT